MERPFYTVLFFCLLLSMSLSGQVPPPPTVSSGGGTQNPHNKIKRWQFGGNLSLFLGDPLLLDVSPTVAYNISQKFRTGVGANYRYSVFKTKDSTTQVLGANTFIHFQPLPWFFVIGEYEGVNVPNPAWASGPESAPKRIWQLSPLLGAGLRVRLLRLLQLNISLLRDFNYQPGISPYPNPWRFRMGFSL